MGVVGYAGVLANKVDAGRFVVETGDGVAKARWVVLVYGYSRTRYTPAAEVALR